MNNKNLVLELKGVAKHYFQGEQKLDVLKGIDLELKKGEVAA